MTEFSFSGAYDTSPYPQLQSDSELNTIVYTRYMYQSGSIERTGAKRVSTHFDHHGINHVVHVTKTA